jgi:hypothetical protein
MLRMAKRNFDYASQAFRDFRKGPFRADFGRFRRGKGLPGRSRLFLVWPEARPGFLHEASDSGGKIGFPLSG